MEVESGGSQLTGLACRVLISGGAAGFGLAIAEKLSRAGASIAIVDIDKGALEDAVKDVGPRTIGLTADVQRSKEVDDAIREAVAAFGGLDVIINSAGICHFATVEQLSNSMWLDILGTNLTGTFYTCRAGLSFLKQSGRGRILNVASVAGLRGGARLSAYVASKFGVIGFTQSLALELAPYQVTVNAVVPASTPDTRMGRQLLDEKVALGWGTSHEEVIERATRMFPLGRVGAVSDIANAVVFLCSREADFITGQSLVVDGGSSIASPSLELLDRESAVTTG